MASVGNLVVNLEANTRGFQRSMQQSQQALQGFAQSAKTTAETSKTMDAIGKNAELPARLDATAKRMGDVEIASQTATEQLKRYEKIADKAALTTRAVAIAAGAFGAVGGAVASGANAASHGLHSMLVHSIALRKTMEALRWIFGVVADGARMLLMPFRSLLAIMQGVAKMVNALLWPFQTIGRILLAVGKAATSIGGPFIGLASAGLMLYANFQALRLRTQWLTKMFGKLHPALRVVLVSLFSLGAAGGIASGVLGRLGFVGRALQAVLRGVAGALKAVINPMATLGVVTRATAGAIKAFVSSALGPLSLALSGFGAMLAAGGMLTLAADAEKLSIQLEVLTGNAETAAQLVETLNKFAGATPFNKMDIKAAAVQLLGVQTPIKEITSDLSMLANIAAMSDNSILELTRMFAQLRTTGTASLQDLQEYSTRNIMLMQHLAKRFGNVAAAASAGQITFDDVRRALYEMSLQADSLSKLNKSLSGQFARLKNNLLVVATAIGNQVLPYATKLLNWASDMIERLGGLEDKLGFLKDLMVAVFDVAFEGIKEKWSDMLSWMIAEGKRRAVAMGKTFVEYIPAVMMARAGLNAMGFGAEPAAQPVKQGGLEAATARLNDVLARLKPVAQPEVKPNLELLPAVKADVGKGVSGFFNKAIEFGQGLVNKGIAWADNTLMEGAAFINQFSGVVRGTGETAQQQEARMAGAMQKGSADAYSAIIGAMMSKKDPLLTATEKQTKATVEPLVDMLEIMKKGGVVGMFKEFVGAF